MMTNIIEVQNWQMKFGNYSGNVRKMNSLEIEMAVPKSKFRHSCFLSL